MRNKMFRVLASLLGLGHAQTNMKSVKQALQEGPKFDLQSVYDKLYEADGEKEVTLTAKEVGDLLDYMEYMTWLNSPR